VATDRRYLGPMPLTQAYRYNADNRDQGRARRAPVVGGPGGVPRCHYAGECSRACPKGVDPARGVQLLKRQLVGEYLGLAGERRAACKQQPPTEGKRLPNIPDPPARTVVPGEEKRPPEKQAPGPSATA
jgi:succinate dehydrogenase / fumarate reductase iron-sulfur subunit